MTKLSLQFSFDKYIFTTNSLMILYKKVDLTELILFFCTFLRDFLKKKDRFSRKILNKITELSH